MVTNLLIERNATMLELDNVINKIMNLPPVGLLLLFSVYVPRSLVNSANRLDRRTVSQMIVDR